MTERDLSRIEAELHLTLPPSYRAAMLRFPVQAFVGNVDTDLWDDAEALIRFNKELRTGAPGGVQPWPSHMFALGHRGDGCPAAIDLREADAPVWWVDRGHLDSSGSGKTHGSFTAWFETYTRDLRDDSLADGVDPEGSPADRGRAEAANARGGCVALIVVVLVLSAAIVGIFLLVEIVR